MIAPHPLARLRFTDCRVPRSAMLGTPGLGFKVAMQTLDIFRTSVAAASLGFARHALDEALRRATTRDMFQQKLADFQITQVKLAPGGRLRIAVPDFEQIAKRYLAGEPIDVQQYTMGSQLGHDDQHRCAFDEELLTELLITRGMERINRFLPFADDSSRLEISLNLEAYKPSGDAKRCANTIAVLSCPRFAPTLHMGCASRSFYAAGVPYVPQTGAYWHQVLCETIEEAIKPDTPYISEHVKYVIACDYDSVFSAADVLELYRLMEACEKADAICAVQTMRNGTMSLFSMAGSDGKNRQQAYAVEFDRNLTPINTGHFGLTIFRADTLRKLPRPWMLPKPNTDGRWADNRVDADIDFWRRFEKDGRQLMHT